MFTYKLVIKYIEYNQALITINSRRDSIINETLGKILAISGHKVVIPSWKQVFCPLNNWCDGLFSLCILLSPVKLLSITKQPSVPVYNNQLKFLVWHRWAIFSCKNSLWLSARDLNCSIWAWWCSKPSDTMLRLQIQCASYEVYSDYFRYKKICCRSKHMAKRIINKKAISIFFFNVFSQGSYSCNCVLSNSICDHQRCCNSCYWD